MNDVKYESKNDTVTFSCKNSEALRQSFEIFVHLLFFSHCILVKCNSGEFEDSLQLTYFPIIQKCVVVRSLRSLLPPVLITLRCSKKNSLIVMTNWIQGFVNHHLICLLSVGIVKLWCFYSMFPWYPVTAESLPRSNRKCN